MATLGVNSEVFWRLCLGSLHWGHFMYYWKKKKKRRRLKSTYFGSFRIGKMAKGKQPPTSYIPPTSKSTKTKQSLQWSEVPRFRLEICLLATVGPFFFSFFFFPYLRSRRFAKSSHINNLVCQSTTQCDHESTPTLFYFYFNNKTNVSARSQTQTSPAAARPRTVDDSGRSIMAAAAYPAFQSLSLVVLLPLAALFI